MSLSGEGAGDCVVGPWACSSSVSPLWTLQHLRFRRDQMLRRLTSTAKRIMTRKERYSTDEGVAIRERPYLWQGCF